MDSPSPPTVPDPVVTAQTQGAENQSAARLQTELNRADQVTPYGTLKWTHGTDGRTFDQAGYDQAMSAYNTATGAQDGQPAETRQAPGPAPDKNSFYTGDGVDNSDKWTSTIALDPRVQQLVDSYLKTSQGMTGSVDSALGRVTDTLGQPINYAGLPASANLTTAFDQANGQFGTNRGELSSAISGQSALAGQSQDLLSSQIDRLKNLYGSEMSFAGAPGMPTADLATRQHVEDALYQRATSRLDPQFANAANTERSTLMNRGIVENSDPWRNEMDTFNRGKNDAYSTALWDSIGKGGDEMQRQFNMQLAARQQGVGEIKDIRNQATNEAGAAGVLNSGVTGDMAKLIGQQTAQNSQIANATQAAFGMQGQERATALGEQERQRAQALNELASLRTGAQVEMPQFSSTPSGANVVPAPYAQSAYNSYQGQQQQYQADVASNNSTMGSMAQMAAMAAMFMSDRRLKRNIKRLGTHPLGIGWYSFDYVWGEPSEGVMADEVRSVRPSAVLRHPSGFDMVNYAALGV